MSTVAQASSVLAFSIGAKIRTVYRCLKKFSYAFMHMVCAFMFESCLMSMNRVQNFLKCSFHNVKYYSSFWHSPFLLKLPINEYLYEVYGCSLLVYTSAYRLVCLWVCELSIWQVKFLVRFCRVLCRFSVYLFWMWFEMEGEKSKKTPVFIMSVNEHGQNVYINQSDPSKRYVGDTMCLT